MLRYLRVNMSTGSVRTLPLPPELLLVGGRGLVSKLLCSEMDPAADPLGPRNVFIVCNGLLAGSGATSSGRLSIGAKSPLTGTIKEANAGGSAGLAMARLGLRALVVEGKPRQDGLHVLVIDETGATLHDASAYQAMGTYALCDVLRRDFGETASVICVGPAGERGYLNASIQVTDLQGRPARAAARGGCGAVMASKGLKAIVITGRGSQKTVFADQRRFKDALKKYTQAVKEHPLTGTVFPAIGTSVLVNVIDGMGAIPTRNFSDGRCPGAEGLSGERIAELQSERGGQMRHACQFGCPIACSQVYHDAEGRYLTSGLEYETIALNGANLGITDIDVVAAIDRICDDAGLDTMETGVTIGVAMEGGIASFGDTEAAIDLARQMAAGTPLGIRMGQGAERFGASIGVTRIPTAKKQALAGYDPRALKGTGVTCATSPMGGDHTAGNTLGVPGLDPLAAGGQIKASLAAQQATAVFDCLGMCIFAGMPAADPAVFSLLGDMLAGIYGGDWPPERVLGLGSETLARERAFNDWAGVPPEADDVPAFMRSEPLPPHNAVFDIEQGELHRIFADLPAQACNGRPDSDSDK